MAFCVILQCEKQPFIPKITIIIYMAIIGNANYYIFTGGPGSGKSTVLNILENMV